MLPCLAGDAEVGVVPVCTSSSHELKECKSFACFRTTCTYCVLHGQALDGLDNATLVASLWRINKLRRSLALMGLTWAHWLRAAGGNSTGGGSAGGGGGSIGGGGVSTGAAAAAVTPYAGLVLPSVQAPALLVLQRASSGASLGSMQARPLTAPGSGSLICARFAVNEEQALYLTSDATLQL